MQQTEKTKTKRANKVKIVAADVAECALFVALMTAAAFIRIPAPLVPLTFQTVISILAGLLLGPVKGAASMAIYCLAGLAGIPVFTSGGGIFYVLKPSFGYILGFIASAVVAGVISSKPKLPFWRYIVGAFAAFLTDYVIGIPYCIVAAHLLNVDDLLNLFVAGNLIYMPKDAVLTFVAAVIARQVLPVISRGRNGLKKPETKTEEKTSE